MEQFSIKWTLKQVAIVNNVCIKAFAGLGRPSTHWVSLEGMCPNTVDVMTPLQGTMPPKYTGDCPLYYGLQ